MQWILLVLFCGSAVATTGRFPIPSWLSKELSLLRSESQTNLRSSQRMLDRIDNYIMRFTYSSAGFQGEYKPPPPPPQPKPGTPRSCSDVMIQNGNFNSLWYMVDPDGHLGSMKPFMVRCKKEGHKIITEFGFSYPRWTEKFSGPKSCFNHQSFGVPGPVDYCADTKTPVPYIMTRSQMKAAIAVSGNCSQRIEWNCHANSLLYVKPDVGQTIAYGRSLHSYNYFSQGICECGKVGRCMHAEKLCHCGADARETWGRDHIVIKDNRQLPISEVILGDLAGSRDKAQLHISMVTCWV